MIWLWLFGGLCWGVIMVRWQEWSIGRMDSSDEVSTAAFGVLASILARLITTALLLIWALMNDIWFALVLVAGFWIGRSATLLAISD